MANLKETFSCEGKWWLPGETGDPLLGTLHYHFQEGLKLELKGIFKPFIKKDPRTSNSPVILGESDHGEKITLYGCACKGVKAPLFSTKEQRAPSFSAFNCSIAFTDHHFSSTEEMKFKKIFVNFSHLDDWLGSSGFNITPDYDKETETSKILIEYIQPKPIIIKINEIFTITIDFFYNLPTGYYNQSEATIKQLITVCVESTDDCKISDFFEGIKQLERFFSLGIMRPSHAFNFMGIMTNPNEKIEKYQIPIKIYKALNENIDVREKIYQEVMLFAYDDIQNNFDRLLQNWFNKREALQPVFDLYFTAVHNQYMPDHLEFLSYIQAIESFHRRTRNNCIRPKQEFTRLRDNIFAKLDEDEKELIGPLDYANEPSLKDRLNEIFKEYYEIPPFFSIKKDQFIRDVVNTRNFHTHYSENLKKKTLASANLHDATRKLRAILQLIFLLELGFDRDGINKFAVKIHRWQLDVISTTFKI